jgi:hypothetical protein
MIDTKVVAIIEGVFSKKNAFIAIIMSHFIGSRHKLVTHIEANGR